MAPSKPPTPIQDYSVLPLTLPSVPSFPHPTTHNLYIRPHSPKDTASGDPTTSLFLVNLPISTTPPHIRHLFTTHLGAYRISSITFDTHGPAPSTASKSSRKRKRGAASAASADDLEAQHPWPQVWDRALHPSGSTAVVTFVDAASASGAMGAVRKASKARAPLPFFAGEVEGKVPALGVARYRAHQRMRFPDEEELKGRVQGYMEAWNEAEEARKREEKRRRQVPDEDGFVTVTRGGRAGVANEEEARRKLEMGKKRMEGLDGFYRWQVRERRREEEGRLKRGFEEERRRVQGMREGRGR
ncbi:Ribosomal RNA-processing protein 7 [Elsinoe australis]|uniref:Ribosomal RNA-processing protein 7 n=1 Tax=Elsinoe australis TaxID=40998 RepID=A0A2P7ZK63_9PEZI|nr:Ribosomal RNA-processing protein 7 [Elsinoe australis]